MRTDRLVTRSSTERVATRPIVDRQTPVETSPSLAVGNNKKQTYTETGTHTDADKLSQKSIGICVEGVCPCAV